MRNPVALCLLVALAGCGDSNNNGNGDGGGGPPGGGSGMFPPGGISFPWPVFDGTVPDVPEASGGGKTWYVDASHGSDSNDGATFATAKKTINAVVTGGSLAAGDTVLLAGGIYREYPDWSAGPTGTASAPVTIGSYGRGTGAPILDGGDKPNTWTRYTAQGQTTVWQSSTAGLVHVNSKQPVLGVYVSSGKGEYALREVIHGQVDKYGNDPLPPALTQTGIVDKSNNWYYDAAAQMLYADFGGTLGTDDPNNADISILYNSENGGAGHEMLIFFSEGHDYYKLIGLTIRASSWNGMYTESSGHVVDHCDFKFNGGAAILFSYPSTGAMTITGNTLTMSRVWMNVLHNWPRFNNGNTGGGWPAAVDWYDQSNGLAQGNVVYENGGEGLTFGNTDRMAVLNTGNQARHNIIFDNFSVNLYLNNTQNVLLEQNYVFQHPRDEAQTFTGLFEASSGYSEDFGKRITPANVSLGDEPGSAYDMQGRLSNITLVNNIFAGGKFGFLDYDDGTAGPMHHGLKNCVIANNTWILGDQAIPGNRAYGWLHVSDGDASMNSIVQNNLFVTTAADDHFAEVLAASGPGIDNDYNLYSGPGSWYQAGGQLDFAAWKSAHPTWDQHSLTADAMVTDVSEFSQTRAQKLVYDWSKAALKSGSPAFGAGRAMQLTTDFTGATRSGHDIGAVSPH